MKNRILKFETDSCVVCRMIQKIIDTLDVSVERINDADNFDTFKKYNVISVPTFIEIDKDGKEISRLSGDVTPASVKRWFAAIQG